MGPGAVLESLLVHRNSVQSVSATAVDSHLNVFCTLASSRQVDTGVGRTAQVQQRCRAVVGEENAFPEDEAFVRGPLFCHILQ